MATKKKAPKNKVSRKKIIRKVVKKPIKKKAAPRKKASLKKFVIPKGKDIIGTVTHYFPKVRAAVIKLKASLANGDVIKIKGHTTDFTQAVNSLQIDRVPISVAKKGQEIGLLVDSRVRRHDIVYKEVKK